MSQFYRGLRIGLRGGLRLRLLAIVGERRRALRHQERELGGIDDAQAERLSLSELRARSGARRHEVRLFADAAGGFSSGGDDRLERALAAEALKGSGGNDSDPVEHSPGGGRGAGPGVARRRCGGWAVGGWADQREAGRWGGLASGVAIEVSELPRPDAPGGQ